MQLIKKSSRDMLRSVYRYSVTVLEINPLSKQLKYLLSRRAESFKELKKLSGTINI